MREKATEVEKTFVPLLKVREVAEYLGVPVQTLYDWRLRHRGPKAVKVGRHLRYRREDVEAWLDDQTAA
jgi:excisionase family DNA binding protein